jgi:Fe-S-cluster-containing hydrogenase component 2
MEAHAMADGLAVLDQDRCIGCGLCVSTCPSGALKLARKPSELQPDVPKSQRDAFGLRTQVRAPTWKEMEDKLKRHRRL